MDIMDNDGIDQYPIDTMEYGCVWTRVWISQTFLYDDDDGDGDGDGDVDGDGDGDDDGDGDGDGDDDGDDDDDMLERVAFSSPKSGTGQWKIGDRWIPGFREFWLKPWFHVTFLRFHGFNMLKNREKRNLMIPEKPIQWVEQHEDSDN